MESTDHLIFILNRTYLSDDGIALHWWLSFLLASQTMSTYRPIVVNPSFEGVGEGGGGLGGTFV